MESPFGQENQTQPTVTLNGICHLDDTIGIYMYVVALILLLIATVGTNTLVLKVLSTHAHLRTSINISYGVLSFIDWLKGAGLIPVLIWTTLVKAYPGSSSFYNLLISKLLIYENFITTGTLMFISINQMLKIRRAQNVIIGLGICLAIPILCVILVENGAAIAVAHCFIYLYLLKVAIILTHIIAFCRVRRYRRTGYNDVDESMVEEMCHGLKTSSLVSALNIGVDIIRTVALAVHQTGITHLEPTLQWYYPNALKIFCASAIYVDLVCSFVNPLIYVLRIKDMKRCIVGLFKKMESEDEEQVPMENKNEDSYSASPRTQS